MTRASRETSRIGSEGLGCEMIPLMRGSREAAGCCCSWEYGEENEAKPVFDTS